MAPLKESAREPKTRTFALLNVTETTLLKVLLTSYAKEDHGVRNLPPV
jgi:hypothetical protein